MEWLWMANRKLLPSNFTTIQQTVQFDGYTRCALLIFGENIGRHYLLKYAICCGYFHSIDQLQSRNQFFFRPWAEQKVNKKRTKMKTHSSFDSQQFVWARKRLLQRHSNRHSLLDAVGSVPLANFRNVESNIFFLPVFDSRRTKSYVCGGMLEGNADNKKKKSVCVAALWHRSNNNVLIIMYAYASEVTERHWNECLYLPHAHAKKDRRKYGKASDKK